MDPTKSMRPGRMASDTTKQPLNLRMDAAVIHRLKRHALDAGKTASDVVAALILDHLKDTHGARSEGASLVHTEAD